jgi:hypothetical protein
MASRWLSCGFVNSNNTSLRESNTESQRMGTQKTNGVSKKSKKQLTNEMIIDEVKRINQSSQTESPPMVNEVNKFTFSDPISELILQEQVQQVNEEIQSHVESIIEEMNVEGVGNVEMNE